MDDIIRANPYLQNGLSTLVPKMWLPLWWQVKMMSRQWWSHAAFSCGTAVLVGDIILFFICILGNNLQNLLIQ